MPQMMPINWMFLLLFFSLIFLSFIIFNYYNFNMKTPQMKNKFSTKKNNMMWKW